MAIALILPGSIWFSPYLRIYTRILDERNIPYSVVSWNREGDDKPEGYQYNHICEKGHGSASLSDYFGYVRFLKRLIKEKKFDKLIVFGPQLTCLLSAFLLRHYRGKFIIDYRDLSIEQKPVFKQIFSLMMKYSCANIISSPGFKRCLPRRDDYIISHNFDVQIVKDSLNNGIENLSGFNDERGIDVLTIGAIRDYSSNVEVVKALGNVEGINLRFVEKGGAATRIEEYSKEAGINNISFTGFYQKNQEAGFIMSSTFMNIYYPRIITHDTALSNRFYNSLIYKKPMIVTKNTTQGDFVDQYNLGVAVENCENLPSIIKDFLKNDYQEYCIRCSTLLRSFLVDYDIFEAKVLEFVGLK
jgi:hypothetical protein